MSKKFTLKCITFLVSLLIAKTTVAQTTVVIGPTTGSSTYSYGPYYRSSATSTSNYSRYAYLYTAAELNIPMGATITKVEWYKASGTISGSNTFNIWMDNSTATTLGTASTSWTTLLGAASQVYASTTQSFSVTGPGYEAFTLTGAPFVYNGTSLKILTDHVKSGTASGANNFYYVAASGMSLGYASATAPSGTTNLTTTYGGSRPTIRITYTGGTNCSAVTFPTLAHAKANTTAFCITGGAVNLSIDSTMPNVLGITYQWQSSPNNATWTNIGTAQTTPAYTATVAATTYYRCQVLCKTISVVLSTTSILVNVNNPGTVTGTGGSHCGPDSITLSAVPSIPGTALHWYATATGGAPIGTGSPWTTPYIPTTTTFYAAAEVNTPVTGTIGTGTTTVATYTYPTAFGNYWYQTWSQMVYTVAELQAAGLSAGNISAATFKILSQPSPNINPTTYSIWMGPTTSSTLSGFTTTGLTQVYSSASQSSVVGNNTLTFTTPYVWDGVSNIILDIRQTESYGSGNAATYYTNTSGNTVVYGYTSSNNPTFWTSNPTAYTSTQRLNVTFAGTGTCSNTRVPVIATINTSPAITITRPTITCSNEIGNIGATSTPMNNYTNYSWAANVTDLYTNAAATTPYTGGSSPNVYLKSTVNGAHTFYLFSSGATAAACTHADTISIWVQPDSITIMGSPDSICSSGTSVLSLVPSTGYAPNSIQWQQSTDGVTYTNITGATAVSYTTPTLTTNQYYRALIKSTNDTCEMPVKHVVVVNPQLISAPDSFTCGPGPVTLTANTGGNSTAKWYNTAAGGNPIATGTPFITPYLATSQSYYVSAEGGAASTHLVQDGTGTSSDGGLNYTAGIYSAYYASTMQMLYTASEIIMAGGTAGNLSSISFNCTGLPANALTNYKIAIKFVPSTMTTLSSWQTGITDVYVNASLSPTATGWNTYPFTALQGWNGTDNIVVQVCKDNNSYSGTGNHQYTSKANRTLYYFNYTTTACGQTGSSSTSNLPNIKIGIQPICGTPRQLIHAYVYPKPVVDLGPDLNMCVDQGNAYVLNAGAQPNTPQYLWDDNSTSQIRAVNTSGTYRVKVTNQYTCSSSDTINVIIRRNPVIDLGNDTTVCNGVNLALDPGNTGIEYFWNTGQTDETITANASGTYSVFVTNTDGCTSSDTIQVTMAGELPSIQGIQISNNGLYKFNFTAVNPQNVIGYDWDFGDTTAHSYLENPTHTYSDNGNYVVVLKLSSTCGFLSDTSSAHIVGIHQINVSNDELSVYPNPTKNYATISINGDLKMTRVEVYNVLGQIIYKKDADSKTKHTLSLTGIASGMYTIQIYTDKGTVARKLEIIK